MVACVDSKCFFIYQYKNTFSSLLFLIIYLITKYLINDTEGFFNEINRLET